ncbi:MAG: 50S ribosomal protein L10 [Clostridia bacterium]|nr:50S ribosomal protein L10 [Clostridia bacterium]
MANASIIAMKEQHVAEICEKIKKAQSVVMFDYRGLTVEEDTNLRNEMRKNGVEYVVLKNSMVERACRELGVDEKVHEMLKGPSAFAFGYDDPVAPAKVLKDFVKKVKKCAVKGGIVDGTVTDPAGVDALADLPSREVLIARMLGSMMSPISGLAIVLDQLAKKLGGNADDTAAAE